MDNLVEGIDYIVCPVCKRKFKKLTGGHLAKHDLNIKSFRELFGNIPTECQKHIEKKSAREKEIMSSVSFREHRSKYAKALWENEEIKNKRVQAIREHHKDKNFREECRKRSLALWKDKTFRDKTISRMVEADNTEEHKEKVSKNMLNLWKDEKFASKVFDSQNRWIKHYSKFENKILYLKSSYEETICTYLETLNIKYLYEPKRFSYFYENKSHSYFPDLYLPTYDLFLEIKPKKLQSIPVNVAKFNSVLSSGRKVIYVGEESLVDENALLFHINTSTTIRKM